MDMLDNVTVVVLAAGRGTRMGPLAIARPKPMLNVLGKNLLEWKLQALPDEVKDIVMVVGHHHEQIQNFFGDSWNGKRIRYAFQEVLDGTAGAIFSARRLVSDRFLVLMGDDLYGRKDILSMIREDWALCAKHVSDMEMKGEILLDEQGKFGGINEEVHVINDGLMNTGMYMLGKAIFDYAPVPISGSSTEFGLPHTLAVLARTIPVRIIPSTSWMQVTNPDDLKRAEEYVKKYLM